MADDPADPTDEQASDEDRLEPTDLVRRSRVVLRAGILMLGAGTSGLRVREVMEANAAAWHLDAVVVTDAFMLFAIGMIVAQRVELYIRARRILTGGADNHMEVAA